MIRFECDYCEGAIPKIMDRLNQTNLEQTIGYGEDAHCAHARALVKAYCKAPDADVHFLVGGTQTNLTVIAAALKPYQAVIAARTGHIAVHETGAIEATGHKVITVESGDGKLTAGQVLEVTTAHFSDETHEHMAQPAMVYISQPTENGTLYTNAELTEISNACRKNGLLFYVDGARLGYGLAATDNDVTAADLARLTDAFYIGGTKVGALFGEALVIVSDALKKDFRYMIKQRGGMLAKGRLLGVQFECLFEDDTYQTISRHAVGLAMRIREAFEKKGCALLYDSKTNQQFPILTNAQMEALSGEYAFSFWRRVDENRAAVRFCTSWATEEAHVDALIRDVARL